MAPSAAAGNRVSSGPRNSNVATTSTRVTSEYSWVRAPAASASAVRLPLLLTGNPLNRPAPTLAAPSATSSWLASISPPAAGSRLVEGSRASPPARSANDRPVRMLSV